MDPIFDRLGNLLRSMFQDTERGTDADYQDAWDELNDFLSDSRQKTGPKKSFKPSQKMPPAELKKDYETLDVPFGASFEKVKESYKNLINQYHPDKHALSEKDFKQATDVTRKINSAFQRIREYEKIK